MKLEKAISGKLVLNKYLFYIWNSHFELCFIFYSSGELNKKKCNMSNVLNNENLNEHWVNYSTVYINYKRYNGNEKR